MRMPSFFSSPTFSLSFLFSGSVKMMYLTFPSPFGEALPECSDLVVFSLPPVKPPVTVPVIEVFLK